MSPWIRAAGGVVLHQGGGIHLVRWLHRKGLRILMYHRFADPELLETQCRHLRRYYRPVSLSQAGAWIRNGDAIPPGALVVTVDDGYADFLEVAQPVFEKYQIPATLFLTTDFLDGNWLWMDFVRYALAHSPLAKAELSLPDGGALPLALDSQAARRRAEAAIKNAALDLTNARRKTWLQNLPATLKAQVPEKPTVEFRPCGWTEVRAAARKGVEFGAHTRSHPILSRITPREQLDEEIAGSKRRIEEELDQPVLHFCYPNGRREDISEEAVETVRRAGFHTAVTAIAGSNHPGADCFRLRRIPTDPTVPEAYFERSVAMSGYGAG